MKMRSNLKIKAGLAIVIAGLGIILAGCQAENKTVEPNGKMTDAHNGSAMHGMQSPPPQANVDATDKKEVQIVIENFAFVPSDITVAPGTKITWINKDEAPHTATSTDTAKTFNSGGLDTDDKFSFVLKDKGDFPYFCALHPQMKASIRVK